MERNQPLVRLGIEWQQNGVILPDTYLLDYDTILENARSIKQAGDANGVQNFFMLKQIGRNPLIARALTDMGYVGAVCVDFREALTMVENQIPLGNVGHLVQIPRAALKKILRAKPVIVTVYTLEKAREISAVCTELGLHQKLMLRVLGEGDMLYSGQYGGFELQELDSAVRAIERCRMWRWAACAASLAFCTTKRHRTSCPCPTSGPCRPQPKCCAPAATGT